MIVILPESYGGRREYASLDEAETRIRARGGDFAYVRLVIKTDRLVYDASASDLCIGWEIPEQEDMR